MCSLLCLLPCAADGQTAALGSSAVWSSTPQVRQKQGDRWLRTLYEGGMVRSANGRWYSSSTGGLSDLVVMNYVDGYSYGLHRTFGHMSSARQRFEIEETVRWASGRDKWMGKGALRWYSPVEQGMTIEAYGGQHTEDFDRKPTMSTAHSLFATGVFGWNHYKLLERTDAGLKLSIPLSNDIDLKANVGWERRRQMQNHRQRNAFGAHAQSNEPRIRNGQTASDLVLYDGPIDGELALFGLQVDYTPHRRFLVYDDMTCVTQSAYPTMSLRMDGGMGRWHYLSLDLCVRQDIALPLSADRLSYMLSAGGIFKHGEIGLPDWHHFDASCFWWQESGALTRFVMLDNYELSTDQQWIEGHAEWNSGRLLLSRWLNQPELLREYLQLHAVKVPQHRAHWEMQYGIQLIELWRMGMALAMDGMTWRGIAFTMSLDLNAGRELRKKKSP